jgi:signal transduction histidine kinase
LGAIGPLYRNTIMLYLLAIVLPALVLLYFGVASYERQRQAVDTLLQSNLRLSGEKLTAEIEHRAMELAQICLGGDQEIERRRHPMAQYYFAIDQGRVSYPPLETAPPSTVDELLAGETGKTGQVYATEFRQAELLELRDGNFEAALATFHRASLLAVSDRLRALALQREARCFEKLKRDGEARQAYVVLKEKYGERMDLSHRPYALVSTLALDAPAAEKAALWHDLARGRWQLSAEQLDFYAPLLGARMLSPIDSMRGPYTAHLRFARGLEEQFRHQGHLQPNTIYSFAFSANGERYQTFYRAAAAGTEDRLLGFSVNPDWLRAQSLTAGTQLIFKSPGRKEELGNGVVRATFPSLFSFWELELTAPAGSTAIGGPVLQGAITVLVLCLLVMGVVLLIRDLSRDARLNQVRADFVGAVSHELKTPITVIRLYGETLLEDEDFSAAQRREFYQIFTRESDRLTQLIDKVLAFSKIDRGERRYQLQQADLAKVVSRTIETYEQYLKRLGYSIETQLAAALPPVRFDADAVSQALVNLLDNAAKYSGECKTIAVRSYATDGCAVLEVEDHGIGIPREEQERIFQRFYRVGSAVAKGGYGLGLYLVRHTMNAHNGRVELDSEPQRGTRFRLIFPAAESGSQA